MVIDLKKYGLVVSADDQTIFPHMSDACSPAVDAQMTPYDTCMPRSFPFYLRSMLKENNPSTTLRTGDG